MQLWEKYTNTGKLKCLLCPHSCVIKPGERGKCGARENRNNEIMSITYGVISGYALDPVEKKPLYHFYPGRNILSVGSFGCNLKCDFCQNYHISQNVATEDAPRLSPEELVSRALKADHNIGIAYTYNEPVIWYEYMTDSARLASGEGLKNVMVTNGYINHKPLEALTKIIDAFNIDLKSFNTDFYRKFSGAKLKPVLETIKEVASSGRHLELTTLIIPGLNDSEDEMRREAEWIAVNAGSRVPLHLSRYFPMYRRDDPPTSLESILNLQEVASEYLDFVYTGNISGTIAGNETLCPVCHEVLIRRTGYHTIVNGLTSDGRCIHCNEEVTRYV
jgi:pyruvate formate lyase activating enzyme